jgi:HUS1 checkpoint protein
MRFRAEISNPTQFTRLVSSLAPLGKVATLKLKSDSVHVICIADGAGRGVQVWRCVLFSSSFSVESTVSITRIRAQLAYTS